MRYLIPNNSTKLLNGNVNSVNEEDITAINSRIDGMSTLIDLNRQAVDKYIADSKNEVDTNKVNAVEGAIKSLESDRIDTNTIDSSHATITAGSIKSLDTVTIYNDDFYGKNIEAENISTSEIYSDKITSDVADFNNASITKLTVDDLAITGEYLFNDVVATNAHIDAITSDTTTTNEIAANTATINEITVSGATISQLIAPEATLQHICNEEIWHSYYNEQYAVVRPGDTIIYEFPKFKQGYYVFTLRDPDTLSEIFSVYITNTESNLTYAYSQGTAFIGKGRNPLVYGKVRDVHSDPRLYLMSNYGGIGYWHYEGLEHFEEVSPATYSTWPFNISDENTMSYEMFHRAATVFTHHLDYGDNTSTGVGGGDFVVKFVDSVEEASKEGIIEYNPDTGDALLKLYVPDQDVDTDSRVQFHRVATDELAITSITENFMFLRSRADGTFEVVLALNPDTITGAQPIDNPITGNALYYWNGVALGGEVQVTDVITIETSKNLNTNIGQGIYKLQQLTIKDGTIDVTSKALKKKTESEYIFFNKVEHKQFNDRDYTKYTVEGTGFEFNGLTISFMDDDGSLYESNFDDYDLSNYSVPSNAFDYNWYDAYHYANATRIPIDDSEGTNEYHLVHLGDGTHVHGSILFDTKISGLAASIPFITTSTLNVEEITGKKLNILSTAGSTLIENGSIHTNDSLGSTLIASGYIRTSRGLDAPVITADDITTSTLDANTITASSLSSTDIYVSHLAAASTITSTLKADSGFFNSVETSLIKAERLRAEAIESLTENADTYTAFVENTNGEVELKSKHLDKGLVGISASNLFENRSYNDKALVYYSEADKDWKEVGYPTKKKQALIGQYADNTLELSTLTYAWGSAGTGSGTVLRLTKQELDDRLAITDPDDDDFVPDGSLVIITDDEQDYIEAEEIEE